MNRIACLAAASIAALGATAFGQTILYPSDDTFVDEYVPSVPFGAYGHMCVRNTGNGPWEDDMLLRFDLSSIPSGTLIEKAVLRAYFWADHEGDDGTGRPLTIYRITSSWAEATATWNNRPTWLPSGQWTDSTPLPANFEWVEWDVTADVRIFLSNEAPNHGWSVMDETYWGGANIPRPMFRSKEHGQDVPYLEITLCLADFNGDGVVDTRDVLAFLNAWAAGDPRADFDGNGVIDTRDVLAFLNAWAAGC